MSDVLVSVLTALLAVGVPIWLIYAALTVTATAVLGWHWPTLKPGMGSRLSWVVIAGLLLVGLAMAAVAVP